MGMELYWTADEGGKVEKRVKTLGDIAFMRNTFENILRVANESPETGTLLVSQANTIYTGIKKRSLEESFKHRTPFFLGHFVKANGTLKLDCWKKIDCCESANKKYYILDFPPEDADQEEAADGERVLISVKNFDSWNKVEK